MRIISAKRAIIATFLLMAATTSQAQLSRFMVAAGGGGTNGGEKSSRMAGLGFDPMAMMGFNYTYAYRIFPSRSTSIGIKTGLNIGWGRPTLTASELTDFSFGEDYKGNDLEYTTTATDVKYQQNDVTFDIPVMLALQTNCFYCNVGAKMIFPIWNRYTQTMSDATIAAYSPSEEKRYVNDPTTGVVSEAQMNLSGKESVSPMYISFAIEFGWAFEIMDGHHIGVEIFADALMTGVGGNNDSSHSVIEVGQGVPAGQQAEVMVNTLPNCYDYKFQYPKFGLKLTYCFDMEHQRRPVIRK